MKKLVSILYVPLFLIANIAHANEATKLSFYDEPRAPIEAELLDINGNAMRTGESETQLRVVNFWALWCVSCRKEMPTLDALSERYKPTDLDVLTVAVGRNEPKKVDAFFEDIGVINLPVYYDPKQKYARQVGAIGLPHTIFLNAKGEEVARVIGEANYADADMIAKIDALLAQVKAQ